MKVSDCCGARVNDLRSPNALFLWGMRVGDVCSKCQKPCTPVEVSEVRRPTSDKKWEVGDE